LVGASYIDKKFDISPSTRNRKIKAGIIPRPDVPALVNGASNKWKQSTIDQAFDAYVGKYGSAA